MVNISQLDEGSEVPLYRQLYGRIAESIHNGQLKNGQRLPATRELAVQLGLNRTTVSAAYTLLEEQGLLKGHVGRGSFVNFSTPTADLISFASSRPAEEHFPLADFQETCREVISGREASSILQLGSPIGYGPLRQYLLDEARLTGEAGPDDDVLITNGCQQALDLLQRAIVSAGEGVVVEDPVYHGLKNVFVRGGARLFGVPMGDNGVDLDQLGRVLVRERPKVLLVTSNFQNPTGALCRCKPANLFCEWRASLGCFWWKTTFTAISVMKAPTFPPSNKSINPREPCCCAVFQRLLFRDCGLAG